MLKEDLVDLARGDLLAASIDHLLETADQGEIAVGVDRSLVAGPKPSGSEGFRVCLRVVGVAVDDTMASDHDLPTRARRDERAGVAHDADVDAGLHSDCARPALTWREGIGGHLV